MGRLATETDAQLSALADVVLHKLEWLLFPISLGEGGMLLPGSALLVKVKLKNRFLVAIRWCRHQGESQQEVWVIPGSCVWVRIVLRLSQGLSIVAMCSPFIMPPLPKTSNSAGIQMIHANCLENSQRPGARQIELTSTSSFRSNPQRKRHSLTPLVVSRRF